MVVVVDDTLEMQYYAEEDDRKAQAESGPETRKESGIALQKAVGSGQFEDEQEEQKQCGETIDAGVYLVVEAPEIEIDLQDDGKADGVVNDAQQEGVGGGSGVGGVEKVRNLEQSYRKI